METNYTKTKKILSLLLFIYVLLTGAESCYSQTLEWAKQIGCTTNSDLGYANAIDASGNVYTTGQFRLTTDFDPGSGVYNLTSSGNSDIFISKLDSAGNFKWARGFGSPNSDWGISVSADLSGNVYTTGVFQGTIDFDPGPGVYNLTPVTGSGDLFISKLDSLGNFVWAKQFSGSNIESSNSIKVDDAGNVYVCGQFSVTVDFDPGLGTYNLTSAGSYDIFVCKLNSSGDFLWAKRIGGTSADQAMAVGFDTSGNVYTTGTFTGTVDFDPGAGTFNMVPSGSETEIFVSKLDSSGNFVWAKRFYGSGIDNAYAIFVDVHGNVYSTGSFTSTVDFNPGTGIFNMMTNGGEDIYISKLNSAGNFVWAKQMGGINTEFGKSITVDNEGNVYTTGSFYGTVDFDPGSTGIYNLISLGSGLNAFLSKLDSLGNFVWAQQLGSSYESDGRAVTVDDSGNLYTTGYFYGVTDFDPGSAVYNLTVTSYGTCDIYIAKFNQRPKIISQNNDTVICYGVGLNFNIGAEGCTPIMYQWQKNGTDILGANSSSYSLSTVSLSDEGVYTCIVSNHYGINVNNGTELKVVVIAADAGGDSRICNGQSTQFQAAGSSNHAIESGTLNFTWSPSTDLSDDSIANPVAQSTANIVYTVKVTDQLGCYNKDSVNVVVGNVFQNEQICLVTVDTTLSKNKIMWEKTDSVGTEKYLIYKETGYNFYSPIGNVLANQAAEFIDMSSTPEAHGDKYKITVLDTCGNESNLSFYHKTMNLTIASFGSTVGLNWDNYVDESGNFVPFRYYIYRGTNANNMVLHDSVSGSFNSYNDLNVFSVYYYVIGVKKTGGCNMTKSNVISFSNKKDNSTLLAENKSAFGKIFVSPNPFSESTTITIPNTQFFNINSEITITDVTGKVVKTVKLQENNCVIERDNLKSGVYFLELKGDRVYKGKLIIE